MPQPTPQQRIAAGQELRRRGSLSPQQDAALRELERRYGAGQQSGQLELRRDEPQPPVQPRQQAPQPPSLGGVELTPQEARMLSEARERGDEAAMRRVAARVAGRTSVRAPENIGEALAGSTESLLRSVGQGAFGVGDYLATGGGLAGQAAQDVFNRATGRERQTQLSPGEMLAAQRGRREAIQGDYQAPAAAGYVTGAVTSGGGVARGAGNVAQRVGLGGAANALRLQPGQRGLNALRMAGQGGAAGAVAGGLEEGNAEGAREGALFGAAGGPIASGLFRLGSNVARRIGRIGRADETGFRALANRIDEDPAVLRQRFDDFVEVTGRQPSLAELVDEGTAAELGQVVRGRRPAERIARTAEEETALARPQTMAEQIGGGRVTSSAPRAELRRDVSVNAQMADIENNVVTLAGDDLDFLRQADVRNALPRNVRASIAEQLQDAGDDPIVELSLRDIENLRFALRQRAGPGEAFRFNQLADEARAIGEAEIPQYGRVLDEFGRRSDISRGIEAGRRVRTAANTERFLDETALASTAEQAGRRVGTRTALAEAAGESPQSAVRTAEQLAQDPGLARRLEGTLRPNEAARLRRLGQVETRSRENLRALSPSSLTTVSEESAEAISEAVQAGIVATGRGSGAFIFSFLARLGRRVALPPRAAEALARNALDPAETATVIERLRALNLSEQEITELFRDAGRAAAIASADAAVNEE